MGASLSVECVAHLMTEFVLQISQSNVTKMMVLSSVFQMVSAATVALSAR